MCFADSSSAAKAAMAILRTGGTAVDAVEISVKVLEDREITNSGYGSNLAIDGVVECDATVVDHHGRSGAVGAVSRQSIHRFIFLPRLTQRRDQESHLAGSRTSGSQHPSAQPSPCPSQSLGRPGCHRIRCKRRHAHPPV